MDALRYGTVTEASDNDEYAVPLPYPVLKNIDNSEIVVVFVYKGMPPDEAPGRLVVPEPVKAEVVIVLLFG